MNYKEATLRMQELHAGALSSADGSVKLTALDGYVLHMAIKAMKEMEKDEAAKACDACGDLEAGDTLYAMSSWDGGLGFDYIRSIRFCPVCGRRLKER